MTVVAFYSYKGGVGRSILMANTAVLLAKKRYKVVCLDFDLDAGGLHKIFDISEKSIKKTTLDVLLEGEEISFTNLDERFGIPSPGHLNVLPNISEPKKLNAVVTAREQSGIGGYIGNKFADIVDTINKGELNPDFILVDSRSGISEIISRVAPKSKLFVLVLKPNRQNTEGARKILEYLSSRKDLDHLIVISQVLSDKESNQKLDEFVLELEGGKKRPEELALINFDKNLLYEEFIPALVYKDFKDNPKFEGYRKVAEWIEKAVMGEIRDFA